MQSHLATCRYENEECISPHTASGSSRPANKPSVTTINLSLQTRSTYKIVVDFPEIRAPEVRSIQGDLLLQLPDELLHALLAENVSEHEGTANADRLDSES